MAGVNITDEELAKAITRLSVFEGMYGYPKTHGALITAARCFAKIVHFEAPESWLGFKHPDWPDVKDDSEWLVERVFETCDKFPMMAEFRRIYCQYFQPRDGREAGED